MESLGLTCTVCEENYGGSRVPRNLGCGHSICTQCVSQVLARDKKCPECRRTITASSATELAVNLPLMKLAQSCSSRRLSCPQQTPAEEEGVITSCPSASGSGTQPDAGECHVHGSRLNFRCLQCGVWICEECLGSSHLDPPLGQCRTLPLPLALKHMKRSHMQTSNSKIQFAEKLQRRIEKEISTLGSVREQHTCTVRSFMEVLQEVEVITKEVKEREGVSLKRLSEVEKMLEELKKTEASVERATTVDEVNKAVEMGSECLAVLKRFLLQDQQTRLPRMPQVVSLGKQTLRGVLEVGKSIFASREENGSRLWARVTEREGLMHLNALRGLDQPPNGLIIPYETVKQLVPRESPVVFLEVAWAGQVRGRVYVRMFGDTPRSQQALLLCSGERGVSYRNTSFYRTNRLNQPGETIRGGDYENNNGTGGRALVQGIVNGGVYKVEVTAGLVTSWSSDDFYRLASFNVCLRGLPGYYDNSGFGIVTSGVETLRAAARHAPTAEAKVQDCGLVIPM